MEAMEEFMSQHNLPHPMGNLEPIPDGSNDQARHEGAVGSSCTRVATGCLESSLTISPRAAEGHVLEMVRRKMVRCLRQAPLLIENLSEDSEADE